MKLYDSLISELSELISCDENRAYTYDQNKVWPESQDYELILQKDTAYELGGKGYDSVNCVLVTTESEYVPDNKIVVYAKELQDICHDTSYARITIVRIKDSEEYDSEKLYQLFSDLEFVKYHIFTKGYMFRNSAQTGREQVRIGKAAIKDGMTFEHIGNTIINHYKRLPEVLTVKQIFITTDQADYKGLYDVAKRATEIRRSLSMIKNNLPTECSICGIKDICNEVEGLNELHFGKKTAKNKQQLII